VEFLGREHGCIGLGLSAKVAEIGEGLFHATIGMMK
jgi:hypothetical protein